MTDSRGLLLPRLVGVLALRSGTFGDLAVDPRAGLQALLVVAMASVLRASAWGAAHGLAGLDVVVLLDWFARDLVLWLTWSGLLWLIATRTYAFDIPFVAFLRAVGFTWGTSVVYVLAFVPALASWHGLLSATAVGWFLVSLHPLLCGILDASRRRAAVILAWTLVAMLLVREVVPYGLRLVPGDSPVSGVSF